MDSDGELSPELLQELLKKPSYMTEVRRDGKDVEVIAKVITAEYERRKAMPSRYFFRFFGLFVQTRLSLQKKRSRQNFCESTLQVVGKLANNFTS